MARESAIIISKTHFPGPCVATLTKCQFQDDNMAVQKSDGTRSSGVDNVWATLASIYGPFGGHKHYPRQISVWETGNGWAALGIADVYFRFHGSAGGKLTDGEGDKWDGVGPGAFQFEYVKTADGGIKLKETKLFSDPTPAIKLMLKAGAINGEQLAGMILSS